MPLTQVGKLRLRQEKTCSECKTLSGWSGTQTKGWLVTESVLFPLGWAAFVINNFSRNFPMILCCSPSWHTEHLELEDWASKRGLSVRFPKSPLWDNCLFVRSFTHLFNWVCGCVGNGLLPTN